MESRSGSFIYGEEKIKGEYIYKNSPVIEERQVDISPEDKKPARNCNNGGRRSIFSEVGGVAAMAVLSFGKSEGLGLGRFFFGLGIGGNRFGVFYLSNHIF